jgi:hypothetical protein
MQLIGIAILMIIAGFLLTIVGVEKISFLVSAIDSVTPGEAYDDVSVFSLIIYSLLVASGIGYLILSYGLLKQKVRTWSIPAILITIGMAAGIFSNSMELLLWGAETWIPIFWIFGIANITIIVAIGISAVTLYYLSRPHVKSLLENMPETKKAEL